MTALFGRTWELTLYRPGEAARSWRELRTAWRIVHTHADRAKPSKVEVSNLDATSRAFCDRDGLRVLLRAGYDADRRAGVLPVVVEADVVRVEHIPSRTDWTTTLSISAGWSVAGTRVAQAFRGASVADAAVQAAAKLADAGLDTRDFAAAVRAVPALATTMPSRVVEGPAIEAIRSILDGTGYGAAVVDTRLVLVPPDDATTPGMIVLSADTGLVGTPRGVYREQGGRGRLKGVEVEMLLTPTLRPGRRVRLAARVLSGDYVVSEVQHDGDSHGDAWTTTALLRAA